MGQHEAAGALGIRSNITMRLVVIPQSMRVVIPPLTNQYLNLIKNSSLAVFIGYPELVQVFAGTVLNQTGAAISVHGHYHGGLSRDFARDLRRDERLQSPCRPGREVIR